MLRPEALASAWVKQETYQALSDPRYDKQVLPILLWKKEILKCCMQEPGGLCVLPIVWKVVVKEVGFGKV